MSNTSKMGRPTVMTPETLKLLREAFAIGCSKKEACAYAKIGESTLYDHINANPNFSEEIERLIQEPILKAKHTIVKSLDDPKNAQWYIERKLKGEFSLRSELTGKDGEAIELKYNNLKDEELDETIKQKAIEAGVDSSS